MVGANFEAEILERFTRDLCDMLELQRIRHKVLPVLTSPGVSVEERPKLFEQNQLVINIRLGWETRARTPEKPPIPNWSQVTYGAGTSVRLARIVTDAVGQWGRCHVFGHQTRNPTKNNREPLLNVDGTAGMLVVPYAINGRQANEYGRRLRSLAESLAWAFSEYLGDDACTGKPFGGITAPKTDVPAQTWSWAGLPEWVLKDPAE